MSDSKPTPNEEDGVTLSPDAPIGAPMREARHSALQPAPGDDGIVAPGTTPDSR